MFWFTELNAFLQNLSFNKLRVLTQLLWGTGVFSLEPWFLTVWTVPPNCVMHTDASSAHMAALCCVRVCWNSWWRRKPPDSPQLHKLAFAATIVFQRTQNIYSLLKKKERKNFSKLISPRINCISYTNNSLFMTVHINIYDTTDLRTLSIIVPSLEGASPWTWDAVGWINGRYVHCEQMMGESKW